jgi:hypothetical protein
MLAQWSFLEYCHVSGVCITNKMFLDLMIEFIEPLYNWLQQFTIHYLTHCHHLLTVHSTGTILTSNWTELNYSIVLLCTPSILILIDYVLYYLYSLEKDPQETHLLPSNGYMRTHIENTSCNTGFIVACACIVGIA